MRTESKSQLNSEPNFGLRIKSKNSYAKNLKNRNIYCKPNLYKYLSHEKFRSIIGWDIFISGFSSDEFSPFMSCEFVWDDRQKPIEKQNTFAVINHLNGRKSSQFCPFIWLYDWQSKVTTNFAENQFLEECTLSWWIIIESISKFRNYFKIV